MVEQLSVAVGSVHSTNASQVVLSEPVDTETLSGQLTISGTVLSSTVTTKLQVKLLLPASSLAT